MTNLVKLACGHKVMITVMPMLQRKTDVHYIRCSTCPPNSGWQFIVSLKEIPNDLLNVYNELPLVLSGWVMRLQSHTKRTRLFPYYNGER